MNRTIIGVIFISVALVLAAIVFLGRYSVTRLDADSVARTNRWTGEVSFCSAAHGCYSGGDWEYIGTVNAVTNRNNSK